MSLCASASSSQKRIHTTLFKDTDYELNVYRIYGKEPGKTLLLIGGIQGDEPGGFLSADLYADFSLAKGNLIVVPRANFHSIVLKRRKINEDMNRKFAEDQKDNYETKVVSILKKLILESDCLLNLHDGSGFYSEKWESKQRNPNRYGQSIIADCDKYKIHETGAIIDLGNMARKVAERINTGIDDPLHFFHFNNHRTHEQNSSHKEQRKSATYYALYNCGKPAFGIETSKSLSLEKKVRHHNLAINAFMEMLDIIPETPGIYLEHPKLRYLVISINKSSPTLIKDRHTLHVKPGDAISISHIEANYERGLSADIIGLGSINDVRKETIITNPTRIVVRKDYYPCGTVYLALSNHAIEKSSDNTPVISSSNRPGYLFYKLKINNKEHICQNYETLSLLKGDILEIVDVISGISNPSEIVVNFKGYVGDKSNNTGEDRGYAINTSEDLMTRYALEKKSKRYQIVVSAKTKIIGKLFVLLAPPKVAYVVLNGENGQKECFAPGDTVYITPERPLEVVDIISDIKGGPGLSTVIRGPGDFNYSINVGEPINTIKLIKKGNAAPIDQYKITILRGTIEIGAVYLKANKQNSVVSYFQNPN